ncbi:hypothetical protein F4778DRAFT_501596 [Xylariomycetidae sp. FL2044]|nr:hypothetical protein F4778DRAFT_501596 [Xylariomycetidae sp. FL2044]
MNNVNMANMPMAGGPVGAPMQIMSNPVGPNVQQIQVPDQGRNNKSNLNTYIYDYFLREGMFDCARAMLNSETSIHVIKNSPGSRRDENGNVLGNGVGDDPMDTDSKDEIDSKRPADLPMPGVPNSAEGCFLYEWFCLFWDMLSAQRNKPGNNPQVSQYVSHTQHQSRMRQSQQQDLLRNMRAATVPGAEMYGQNPMMRNMPNGMQMNAKQPNLARTAMANNQNNPQMLQLQNAAKNQMQRDGSNMDGNQNRPGSPGSADNAPSPNKRPRLDGSGPFNPQQANMMVNGRPQQGMPAQQVGNGPRNAAMAQHMLSTNGIDPANLTPQQFQNFTTQTPQAQAKSIQSYSQNLQQHHGQQMPNKQMPNAGGPPGQGSPMMTADPNNPAAALGAFYNAGEMGAGGMRAGPNAAQGGGGSNHALQDYQMQLMLLEQQNKKRLMMARQEQDSMGGMPRDGAGPGGPGGPQGPNGQPFPDTSPQGVRTGASPNPAEQMKRGTPQMNPAGIASPVPEGPQSRGSPNPMNFMPNGMDPSMQGPHFFKQMNGMDGNMAGPGQMNGMRPPNAHPNQPFNAQMNPQMMRQQPNGPPMQWQGGPNGNGMAPQGPQGPMQGTPQPRSMPPPSAPAQTGNGANGRPQTSSPQQNPAPPTPQQSNKAAPKKKDTKNAKSKAAAQKNKNQAAGATPASEATQDPEPPTPATPITPMNPQTFNKNGQNGGQGAQAAANAPASAPPPAPAPVAAPQAHPDPSQMNTFGMDNGAAMDFNSMDFANPLTTGDVLQDFDFDSFLHDGDGGADAFVDFNPATFGMEGTGEIGAD